MDRTVRVFASAPVILLAIGFWGSRESGDLEGYYVAGKRLPAWVIAFSSNATGESAWLLLGLTGMGYLIGVHAFWVILGEVLGVAGGGGVGGLGDGPVGEARPHPPGDRPPGPEHPERGSAAGRRALAG